MNCPCGGATRRTERELVTLTGAREWMPTAQPEHLPLRVEIDRCEACGRQRVVLHPHHSLTERRG
ncbi:MAG TPA: hypothetical protein VFL54_06780 [Gammaproteobacteria bacterium]|nr:hypothetical protein [Gammaproteobacteria bacterium]